MTVTRRSLAALCTVVLWGCGGSDVDDAAPPPAAEDGPAAVAGPSRPQTLAEAVDGPSRVPLWQVSDEDTLVYLLGTVHLMQPGTSWKTDAIRAAMTQAEATYLEADVFSKDAQRAMGIVVTRTAENPGGTTLSSFYTRQEQETIREAMSAIGLSLSDMDAYRPWFAAMQLGVLALVEAGGDPTAGVDISVARAMQLRDVPLRYLETAAQQISLLSAGDDEKDAQYLLDLVSDLGKGEAYYADLIGAWYEGDTERLDFLVNGRMQDYPDLHRRLVIERNMDWAQQIDRLMTDEPGTFLVAVGAGHLVGEHAVQEQLAARGYAPQRVE